jgi:hypothetical protein
MCGVQSYKPILSGRRAACIQATQPKAALLGSFWEIPVDYEMNCENPLSIY